MNKTKTNNVNFNYLVFLGFPGLFLFLLIYLLHTQYKKYKYSDNQNLNNTKRQYYINDFILIILYIGLILFLLPIILEADTLLILIVLFFLAILQLILIIINFKIHNDTISNIYITINIILLSLAIISLSLFIIVQLNTLIHDT